MGKKWWIATALLLLLLIPGTWIAIGGLENRLRIELVQWVEQHFQAKAEIGELHLSVFPYFQANGKKIVLRKKNSEGFPPLITVDGFSFDVPLSELAHRPVRVHQLTLRGLVIQVPPKQKANEQNQTPRSEKKTAPEQRTKQPREQNKTQNVIVFETIYADGTSLKILPGKPDQDPLIFELYKLTLRKAGQTNPMQYEALLKNAKPPGLIQTNGTFGPWAASDPGETPVTGNYKFEHADLSVFHGLKGTLSSTGKFEGVLRRLVADGQTDTPNFAVNDGHTVHLTTQFHSIIDGTDGDTVLQPVIAHFGKTEVECRGAVAKKAGEKAKTISLDATVKNGRIEDLVGLVLSGKPPLTGAITFQSHFDIPPGEEEVVKRIRLNGKFQLKSAEFTSNTVQSKIEKLSLRSRGIHEDSTNERIVSDMQGAFALSHASVRFSTLAFSVPGAKVELHGHYGLTSQKIDFQGTLKMQAKISQTQTGIKSLLLKLVDPFFKKGTSGAVLPIKITGERNKPEFALNLGGSKD